MNTFILIVVLILWIAVRSHAVQAKRKAEKENAASEPSQPSFHSARSAFESLFDEEVKSTETHTSFDQEERSAGYYSYESFEEPDLNPGRTTADTVSSPKAWTNDGGSDSSKPDFDLRQAIIYQTILSNKYLEEMRTYEN